jgi:hypothetical protein
MRVSVSTTASNRPKLDSRCRMPLYPGSIGEEVDVEHVWARGAGVTVEAAAELAGVDVAAVRRWQALGLLSVELLGDIEAVPLRQLEVLMRRYPHRERVSDAELQRLTTERSTDPA